jgi:outer membrane lipoprotein-sorting protein
MTSTRLWDRAGALTVPSADRRRPEIVALPPRIPTLDELFTFMRDAELRFETLLMRIEERTFGTRGEQLIAIDVAVRHPGRARVTTTEPGPGVGTNFETWISDGEVVRTYSRQHKLGTQRPVRPRVRGLDEDGEFPGASRVYRPLTALPMETLPDTFIHPAGYCQNVLATGRTWVSGTDIVRGREAIVVRSEHPRTIEMAADRPDFNIEIAVDPFEGVILRLVESIAGEVTRAAEVVAFQPDAALPAATFDFEFPAGTTMLY